MPDLKHMNAAVQNAIGPQPSPGSAHTSALLRALVYGLQAADAANSSKAFGKGLHETNPLMRPFSHGGPLMMGGGFALGDLVRNALLRHASQGTQNTAAAAQALSNLLGIGQTNAALHGRAGATPPLVAPTPAPPQHRIPIPGGGIP